LQTFGIEEDSIFFRPNIAFLLPLKVEDFARGSQHGLMPCNGIGSMLMRLGTIVDVVAARSGNTLDGIAIGARKHDLTLESIHPQPQLNQQPLQEFTGSHSFWTQVFVS
jgi:hypothetical protein